MRISIVNPNSSTAMTRIVAQAAIDVAQAEATIVTATNEQGPLAIEGVVDGALAVPGMLSCMRAAEEQGADAHIIACFDDTGLDAARALLNKPVIGIGEAGAKAASFVSTRFTVITTLACSVPILENNLYRYGFTDQASVRASNVPVLALERDQKSAVNRISEEIARALNEDRAEAIVLGCAGMADLAAELSRQHGIPVIDGVRAAVKFSEGLIALSLATAKRGLYAVPSRV